MNMMMPMMTEDHHVNWLYSYDEGLRKAKTANKIVLLFFYSDWCSWCDKLDQETDWAYTL